MTGLDANEGNALLFASCIANLWQSAPQMPQCQLYPAGCPRPAHSSGVENSVEIPGIDSFSGKPELQDLHLVRPVKNLAREKDLRQHSHAAERHA